MDDVDDRSVGLALMLLMTLEVWMISRLMKRLINASFINGPKLCEFFRSDCTMS